MLEINIEPREVYNPDTGEIFTTKPYVLRLEHSLISISKWEMKYHKTFLEQKDIPPEEMFDYIKMMSIERNAPQEAFSYLSNENMKAIYEYISNPMTSVYIDKKENKNKGKQRDKMTNEYIYWLMTQCYIPFECDKWHINHLMALIEVCMMKNNPPDKKKGLSASDLSARSMLNAKRRAALGSKG